MPGTEEGQKLLGAVQELTGEVRELHETLHRDYPKRTEMRSVLRRRIITYAIVFMLMLGITQIMTMLTISHCFLDASVTNTPRIGCSAMPGYGQAIEQNQVRLNRFYELTNEIQQNRVRVTELELEIEKLKQSKAGG